MKEGPKIISRAETVKTPERRTNLSEGVRPLMACVIDSEDQRALQKTDWRNFFRKNEYQSEMSEIRRHGLNNLYTASEKQTRKAKIAYVNCVVDEGWGPTYLCLMSPVDSRDKYSEGAFNCFLILGIGTTPSGEQISFLGHFNPDLFTSDSPTYTARTKKLLTDACNSLVQQSQPGTIDITICGGNMPLNEDEDLSVYERNAHEEQYKKGVALLSEWTQEGLGSGIEPAVVTGPNTGPGETKAYLKTDKRHFFLERPRQEYDTNKSFTASEMEEKVPEWKEKDLHK